MENNNKKVAEIKRKKQIERAKRNAKRVVRAGKATAKATIMGTKFVIANFSVIAIILAILLIIVVIASAVTSAAGAFLVLFRPESLEKSYDGNIGIDGSNNFSGSVGLPKLDEGSRFYFPVEKNTVTSLFGPRKSPGPGGSTYHRGIDIGIGGSSSEIYVYPSRPGKVTKAVKYANPPTFVQGKSGSGYGQYVEVEHIVNGKKMYTRYAHLYRVLVSPGEEVGMGTPLGIVGNTGTSFGAHLHFEIINTAGQKINPALMLYCGETPIKIGLSASECFKYRFD